jgi:hypothetical protein
MCSICFLNIAGKSLTTISVYFLQPFTVKTAFGQSGEETETKPHRVSVPDFCH